MYLECDHMIFGVRQLQKKDGSWGLFNIWRNCAHVLDNSRFKIFVLDLDTLLRNIYVLELDNSN